MTSPLIRVRRSTSGWWFVSCHCCGASQVEPSHAKAMRVADTHSTNQHPAPGTEPCS